jgi:hypothetical protein
VPFPRIRLLGSLAAMGEQIGRLPWVLAMIAVLLVPTACSSGPEHRNAVPFVERQAPARLRGDDPNGLLRGEPTLDQDPLRVLPARIVEAPRSVRFGEPFTYVVELTNPSGAALRLRPCPYFHSWFGEAGIGTVVRSYLNCEAKPTLRPHETARFVMKMTTPREKFAGEAWKPPYLRWSLRGSSEVTATVAIRVPPISE